MIRGAGFNAWLITIAVLLLIHPQFSLAQLSPDGELGKLRPAPEFDVKLFAAEPLVTNPSAIDVDTKGRVWVAEIQWYRRAAKTPPADKIKVLEDTDGDGLADKMTVFAEGLFCPMSVCVAGDKVYVATSPDLWVFDDQDGDLKADGPPRKLLTGFGGVNHDHGAHSLVLGPDHKWWMAHGDGGANLKGTDGSVAISQWGAVIRGELDGSQLETVAVNFRNPYEVCVSSFGEAFCSDNDNDGLQSTRICWILEGGNYGWFGRPPGRAPAGTPFGEHWHFRGHVAGHVPATLLTGFGSPCGICFYEGDAFGPAFKNVPFHTDAGPAEVRFYKHQIEGAGMRASSQVVLSATDRYFRPDDICAAPDGSLYVSDWYDGGVGGHAYNNPAQGRIFQLQHKGQKLQRREKPGPYDNLSDALEGLKSPNLATQYLARVRLLAEGEKSIPSLTGLLADSEPNYRARALWVLDRIGGAGRRLVVEQLQSQDAAMRALAVRILRRHREENAADILPLANDNSLEVVREVLLAIRNIDSAKAVTAAAEIAKRYDGRDRYLLEAINIAAGDRKSRFYEQLDQHGGFTASQIDLLQLLNPKAAGEMFAQHLFDPKADAETTRKLLLWAGAASAPEVGNMVLEYLQKNNAAEKPLRELALNQLAANVKGPWTTLARDERLRPMLAGMLSEGDLREPAVRLIATLRLAGFNEQVLAVAGNTKAEESVRVLAIQSVAQQSDEKSATIAPLQKLLADERTAVRNAAVLALVDLQDFRSVRDALANQQSQFPARFRSDVINRLLTSSGGALAMLKLVENDQLPAQLKQQVIDRAVQHPDANVRVLFQQFVPPEKRPQRLGEKVSADDILALIGDAQRGSAIFQQSTAAQCNKCHTVDGKAGGVGPDLSMIGKKYERAALLETILDPSKAIAPEYITYVAETSDGRVLAGFLVEKSEKEITLKDAQNHLLHLPADQVESLAAQKRSQMPDLVLRDVTAQDAADLLAYLLTLK